MTKVNTLDEFLGDPHKVDLIAPNVTFAKVSGLTPPLIEDTLYSSGAENVRNFICPRPHSTSLILHPNAGQQFGITSMQIVTFELCLFLNRKHKYCALNLNGR